MPQEPVEYPDAESGGCGPSPGLCLSGQPLTAKTRARSNWGIRTNIADYGLADPLPCAFDRTTEPAALPTRLKRMDDELQERVSNWGYVLCGCALRRYYKPDLPRPAEFPCPAVGV